MISGTATKAYRTSSRIICASRSRRWSCRPRSRCHSVRGSGIDGVGGVVAINVANIGRAIPIYALLVLAVQIFGITSPRGFGWTGSFVAFVPLVLLGIPPMLTNSYIGVRDVGDELVDAARGMGLSDGEILRRVEIPVAMPLIMAGIRTAMVGIVATATLASFTGVDTLATPIYIGLNTNDNVAVFGGALLVALLARRRRSRTRGWCSAGRLAGSAAARYSSGGTGVRRAPASRLGCYGPISLESRDKEYLHASEPPTAFPGLALGAMLIALALVLAACGSSSKPTPSVDTSRTTKIVVGEKDFAGARAHCRSSTGRRSRPRVSRCRTRRRAPPR